MLGRMFARHAAGRLDAGALQCSGPAVSSRCWRQCHSCLLAAAVQGPVRGVPLPPWNRQPGGGSGGRQPRRSLGCFPGRWRCQVHHPDWQRSCCPECCRVASRWRQLPAGASAAASSSAGRANCPCTCALDAVHRHSVPPASGSSSSSAADATCRWGSGSSHRRPCAASSRLESHGAGLTQVKRCPCTVRLALPSSLTASGGHLHDTLHSQPQTIHFTSTVVPVKQFWHHTQVLSTPDARHVRSKSHTHARMHAHHDHAHLRKHAHTCTICTGGGPQASCSCSAC